MWILTYFRSTDRYSTVFVKKVSIQAHCAWCCVSFLAKIQFYHILNAVWYRNKAKTMRETLLYSISVWKMYTCCVCNSTTFSIVFEENVSSCDIFTEVFMVAKKLCKSWSCYLPSVTHKSIFLSFWYLFQFLSISRHM